MSGSQNPCQVCPAAGLIVELQAPSCRRRLRFQEGHRPRAWKFHPPLWILVGCGYQAEAGSCRHPQTLQCAPATRQGVLRDNIPA